jgi:hypothetical protein
MAKEVPACLEGKDVRNEAEVSAKLGALCLGVGNFVVVSPSTFLHAQTGGSLVESCLHRALGTHHLF